MKVRLKRTGGIGGMTRQWMMESDAIPNEKKLELKKLLESANFLISPHPTLSPLGGEGKGEGGAGRCRDFFCYELTVEEQGKKKTVQCSEAELSKPLREWIDWIMKAGKQ